MEKFLINMAIVKVNWDVSSRNILDNYIPLVGYAVKCCDGDIVALEDVEAKLRDIADFTIPREAIIILLKRATSPHYRYIKKEDRKYVKLPEQLSKLNYERLRDEQSRRFNALKITFRSFCFERFNVTVDENEADEYFFDILYDIAPSLYRNLKFSDSDEDEEHQPEITRKYLVSSFVQDAVKNDPTSFAALEAFVRGAMLTETFYYSSPEDIQKRFRKTKVFFDTTFILRLLGYCSEAYSRPCKELHEMLSGMTVQMRCFRKTFEEIHGILLAATKFLKRGRIIPNRPDDAFDYFAQNGYSSSDIEYEIATIEDNLRKLRIYVEEHPPHEKHLTVDEQKLDNQISEYIQFQREKARYHDIDCLTSIFRLRQGRPQKYLESCVAIFVTTNSSLARASTKFFNSKYSISEAPVCMADQVFTTLVWLKAVKKIPDLPKERLVANCYAALNPSEELWQKYLAEAEKLYKLNRIGEHDYAVLIHSLEARRSLMDLTLGDDDICLAGTVEEVLSSAKAHYLAETEDRIRNTERKYSGLTKRLDEFFLRLSNRLNSIIYLSILLVSTFVLIFALVMTSPEDIRALRHIYNLPKLDLVQGIAFLVFAVLTLLNITFGLRTSSLAHRLSNSFSRFFVQYVRSKFFADNLPRNSARFKDRKTWKGENEYDTRTEPPNG